MVQTLEESWLPHLLQRREQTRYKWSWTKTYGSKDDGDNGFPLEWLLKKVHSGQAGFGRSKSCQMNLRLINCKTSENPFLQKQTRNQRNCTSKINWTKNVSPASWSGEPLLNRPASDINNNFNRAILICLPSLFFTVGLLRFTSCSLPSASTICFTFKNLIEPFVSYASSCFFIVNAGAPTRPARWYITALPTLSSDEAPCCVGWSR